MYIETGFDKRDFFYLRDTFSNNENYTFEYLLYKYLYTTTIETKISEIKIKLIRKKRYIFSELEGQNVYLEKRLSFLKENYIGICNKYITSEEEKICQDTF